MLEGIIQMACSTQADGAHAVHPGGSHGARDRVGAVAQQSVEALAGLVFTQTVRGRSPPRSGSRPTWT